MEGTVGIRVFRDRLTRYVARVRRGQRVVVTDRGRPIAVLIPYETEGEPAPQRARLTKALSSGHVVPSERRPNAGFTPVRGKGELASWLIIDDRRL